MLKKLCFAIAGIVLLAVSAFFVTIIFYLGSSEIMPAIEKGSLNVESNAMILNRVWVGNEIYVLLTIYSLLAFAFAYGSIRVFKKVRRA